jgi:hypothetical protein
LAKIAALPVESWNYKNTTERHIGPVAEDFVAAFDVGTVKNDGPGTINIWRRAMSPG